MRYVSWLSIILILINIPSSGWILSWGLRCQYVEVLYLEVSWVEGDDFVEAVHIELPDEGGHVGMFVVVGQQTAGELRLVSDPERSAIVCPADVVIYQTLWFYYKSTPSPSFSPVSWFSTIFQSLARNAGTLLGMEGTMISTRGMMVDWGGLSEMLITKWECDQYSSNQSVSRTRLNWTISFHHSVNKWP